MNEERNVARANPTLSGVVYGSDFIQCSAEARFRAEAYFGDVPCTLSSLDAIEVRTNGDALLHYESHFVAVCE